MKQEMIQTQGMDLSTATEGAIGYLERMRETRGGVPVESVFLYSKTIPQIMVRVCPEFAGSEFARKLNSFILNGEIEL